MQLTLALHKVLRERPQKTATVFQGRRQTNAQMIDRVARLAGAFQAHGVKHGDRIGMLSPNTDRYIEYVWATLWAGGVFNPVNARWSAQEIAFSLEDSDTRVLLVTDEFVPMVDKLRDLFPGLETVIHVGDADAPDGMLSYEGLIASHDPVDDAGRGGDDLAGLLYTGGTTGRSKGVMLSHDNILWNVMGLGAACRNAGDAPGLHVAPFFHIGGIGTIFQFSYRGSTQVVLGAFDAGKALRLIEEERVGDIFVVPTMLRWLLDHPDRPERDLTSLRTIRYGAAPIDMVLLEQAIAAVPTTGFTHLYGQTEFSPVVTALRPEDHLGEGAEARLKTIGRPIPTAEVKIVDEDDREVPIGEVGEIAVRGPQTMLGYWNRPEETAHAMRGGWLHTGDAGRVDEQGYVYIVDRVKDMIVSGGENVYSAEVENALASMPQIAASAVVAVKDPDWSERVHAVIVPKPGANITLESVRAHVKSLIADYKAPRSISLVEELPLSPAGKVLKHVLRAELAKEAE
ncbi:long-chain acyl-CoA synthetase [Thalassovita litoralis]|uniref:3-methylmercaptopropionyl-CoA ligase n=1 Tax=Thalassovita litoralis TaxID=1010611 RepID=A0A521EXQ3_9RHOB|nr:long-chain-fatty-acid--CoA ligase [Thalassovita litoralis]SMO88667.1 long-chain acyl-CoA synthetase [Thalassovita litoralis]